MATVIISQDIDYIKSVRAASSELIQTANMGIVLNTAWNNNFGGVGRLEEGSFVSDEGLVKADIDTAKSVLSSLNTWLDEAGMGRRVALEKVFDPRFQRT